MEEAKAHPAATKRLIQGREDDIAHTGPHLPEQRPLVIEEHAQGEMEREPGRKSRPLRVAILVREREVVEAADERRVDGGVRGTMAGEPLAQVEVVDGVIAVGGEPVSGDSAHHRLPELDQLAGSPGRSRAPVDRPKARPRPFEQLDASGPAARLHGRVSGRGAERNPRRRPDRLVEGGAEAAQQREPALEEARRGELGGAGRSPRQAVVLGEPCEPKRRILPARAPEADHARRHERVTPGLDRAARIGGCARRGDRAPRSARPARATTHPFPRAAIHAGRR